MKYEHKEQDPSRTAQMTKVHTGKQEKMLLEKVILLNEFNLRVEMTHLDLQFENELVSFNVLISAVIVSVIVTI